MLEDTDQYSEELDTGSTARIDRRNTILAQIEAALLSGESTVVEGVRKVSGADPYNCGRTGVDVWGSRRR
jgi:hypothetical protein